MLGRYVLQNPPPSPFFKKKTDTHPFEKASLDPVDVAKERSDHQPTKHIVAAADANRPATFLMVAWRKNPKKEVSKPTWRIIPVSKYS